MDRRLSISLNSASSPALKVALGHLLVATWWFSGREKSSVNAHLSSRVWRQGTSYRAPSATLHPWTVSRRLWKHVFYLISDCTLHFHCCMQRIFSIGLCGVLESVTVLRRLRNCGYIIIIIILNSTVRNCFFVELRVKINGAYYRDVLLTQKLLPVIRQISRNEFVFQQDSAPAHRARETIELLRREMRRTLSPEQWPPNSPDLNPVDSKISDTM